VNRSYSAKIKLKTMFGHRFHSLLKLHVGQRGVPYKLTVNSDRLWENRKPTDKSNISKVQVLKLKTHWFGVMLRLEMDP